MLRLLPAALLLVLGASNTNAAEPGCIACDADREAVLSRYDADDLVALRRGEVVTWTEPEAEGGEQRVRAAFLVEAPPRRVWELLTDYESWPEFMPQLEALSVLSRRPEVRLHHEAQLLGMSVEFGTVRRLDPPEGRIEVALDPRQENDLERNDGDWQLVALDGGGSTLVELRLGVEARWWLPAALERRLVRHRLPTLMDVFRQELRRRGEA